MAVIEDVEVAVAPEKPDTPPARKRPARRYGGERALTARIPEIDAIPEKGSEASSQRMHVTPQVATKWMEDNKNNRNISMPYVDFLAKQMRAGQWFLNGESIRFNDRGELIDGQHRLMACIVADAPFETWVMFNLQDEAKYTIDSGRKRSVGDHLSISGEAYSTALAATIRTVPALLMDSPHYKMTTPDVFEYLKQFPQIRDSVSAVKSEGEKVQGASQPVLAAIHFIGTVGYEEPDKADAFVEVFRSGAPTYDGDAAHAVRERHIKLMIRGDFINRSRQFWALSHAWNLFRKERPLKMYRIPEHTVFPGLDTKKLGIVV